MEFILFSSPGAVLASPTTQTIKNELTKIVNSTQSELSYEIFTGIHATFAQGAYFTVDGKLFITGYKLRDNITNKIRSIWLD